jgi:hypothetical protein
MGHKKEKFVELQAEFKTPIQPQPRTEREALSNLGRVLTETLTTLSKLETHCFDFAHEFLKSQSGNFKQTALNFEADGLVAQYHCSSDDRIYTVKITASK